MLFDLFVVLTAQNTERQLDSCRFPKIAPLPLFFDIYDVFYKAAVLPGLSFFPTDKAEVVGQSRKWGGSGSSGGS